MQPNTAFPVRTSATYSAWRMRRQTATRASTPSHLSLPSQDLLRELVPTKPRGTASGSSRRAPAASLDQWSFLRPADDAFPTTRSKFLGGRRRFKEACMKFGIIGLLILVALGWIAWPYYAVYDFANAIQQGDQVALERRVAWDSVRGGLREDFNAVLARSTQGAGLAALVGPAIINNAIDSFVTPQGIASLLRIAKAPIPNADRSPSSTIDDKQRDRLQLEQVKYAFFWAAL